MDKLKVCVLGATGAAGQNVVKSLRNHPWFEISRLAASERSSGKRYSDAIRGAVFFDEAPSQDVLEMEVSNVEDLDPTAFGLVFSALPSSVARVLEPKFARHAPVISTASAFRYERDVPILIPEVNPEHARLIDFQKDGRGWEGYICPGPNCTAAGLAMTLKPIYDTFGVQAVHMVSMQALSGAGERGLRRDSDYRRSVEMNVLPYIDREEEKVCREAKKILGRRVGGGIMDAEIKVHCSCNRVYVENVHTEVVYVGTREECSVEEVKQAFRGFVGEPQRLRLPSAPERPIVVLDEEGMPQPRLHHEYGGMVTLVGRVRRDTVFENGMVYVLTSDNTDRGAGGGAVLTAEYLKATGYV
ncbi:MAG: aspartate-semialdehyde dehydrogenase [Candidatus Bathyarchaeia archaeon]